MVFLAAANGFEAGIAHAFTQRDQSNVGTLSNGSSGLNRGRWPSTGASFFKARSSVVRSAINLCCFNTLMTEPERNDGDTNTRVVTATGVSGISELLSITRRVERPFIVSWVKNLKFDTSAAYTTDKGAAFCGDSRKLLAQMADERVNLVVTSPPFALLRQKE